MNKVLVTGSSGFVAAYLIKELLKTTQNKILGTFNSSINEDFKDSIEQEKINLQDSEGVNGLISKFQPDIVYHLAASTSPKASFEKPNETLINNISMEANILEAIRKNKLLQTKIIIISSAEIYGTVAESDLPIDEDTPLNPVSPYAVSKIAQDFLALQYFNTYNLRTVRMRPFNHTGPGQSSDFVVPAFAKQIAEIEKGKLDKISVGNLDSKKDFTDVRDIVKAYILASEKAKDGQAYNLGSGKSHKISEILNMLIGFSKSEIKVVEDPTRLRPGDNPNLVCDYSRFNKATGWEPEISLEQTLKETLDYWRSVV